MATTAPAMSQIGALARGASIEIADVSKQYGGRTVLGPVSLSVAPSRFLVLLGPSGSGKTTLLRCAAGIERITHGQICIGGVLVDDGRRQLPPERRNLAMVFQDYALWPHMNALQNVAYALRRRRQSAAETNRRALELLDRVGLKQLAENYPSELSGGEQQRVALARALVADPGLLLFDEPLSNLDANLREQMRRQISTLTRDAGSTVIYITHDQSEAFALADEIGVLEKGRLVQFGRPEEIYRAPSSPFVARLTGIAGEVQASLVEWRREGASVVMCGTVITATTPQGQLPAREVTVMIRPAGVHLVGAAAGTSKLCGTIHDVAYSGRGYEHVVDLECGAQLTGIFDSTRRDRGARVGVVFDPDSCLAFPIETRTGTPAGDASGSQ
jgi:ABC-type Fe3+/spermidine/putrescine transport system ATPase subunit